MKTTLLALSAVVLAACGGGSTALDDAYETCQETGNLDTFGDSDPEDQPDDLEDLSGIRVADEGATILIDGEGEESGSGDAVISDIACVLNALDTPEAVISRIDSTNSLQGQQEADWTHEGNDIHAFWTYHPSNGLDVIIELVED